MIMKNLKYLFFAGLVATSVGLTSCNNDDEEITIEYASKLAGDFEGSEVCDGGDAVGPYMMHIFNTADDANAVWVEGIWDYAPRVRATVNSDNSFSIPAQQVIHRGSTAAGNDTFNIVSGSGTVNGKELVFDFQLDYDGDAVNCQFKGNRN